MKCLNQIQIETEFSRATKFWKFSAKEWEVWNNREKPQARSREVEYSEKAEAFFISACKDCGVTDITIDYPGLYPSFKINGYHFYDVESVINAIFNTKIIGNFQEA